MLIGKLAEKAKVSRDTIRHYVEIGLLKPSTRSAGTRKYSEFSDSDLEKLELILLSKTLGFTLNEMKPYIEMYMNEDLPDQIAKTAFEQKLTEVEDKISQLKQMRVQLKQKIQKYEK